MYRLIIKILLMSSIATFAKAEIDIMTLNANDKNTFVEYTANFKFNNMHCIFKINGLLYTTSTLIRPKGWKLENISLSDDIGAVVQQGKNTLEIEGIQVPTKPKEGTVSYCEMSIYASATNRKTGETGGKEVSHLRLDINDDGKFTTERSRDFPEPSVTNTPELIELDRKTVELDWINNDTTVKRLLYINHKHDIFTWTKSKPFENTPENIARLWDVYDELIDAFAIQNLDRIEQFLLPAGKERDLYTGYTGTGSRRVSEMMTAIQRTLNQHGFNPPKANRDNYELEVANHGKLFRFNYKGGFNASPIRYKLNNKKSSGSYNFYFTEVDGKIRIGVL
ncbi:hypothetical protein [Ignatzschineria sp. LJL83]